MNKKAQIFSAYLVILTIFMTFIVIYTYLSRQSTIEGSIISPTEILSIRDELSLFELMENETIAKSLKNTKAKFKDENFIEEFRQNFLSNFMKNEKMKTIITEDLFVDGRKMDRLPSNFFSNKLYRKENIYYDGDKLIFKREKIGKYRLLSAKEKSKVNFPVEFLFEFEKTYEINFNENTNTFSIR